MAKGKDFYGSDVTEVIARACKDLGASQEELDIEVIETGSAGIFGLCKKKAHIRARRKSAEKIDDPRGKEKKDQKEKKSEAQPKQRAESPEAAKKEVAVPAVMKEEKTVREPQKKEHKPKEKKVKKTAPAPEVKPEDRELPSDKVLASIRDDIVALLEAMTFPSEVSVELVDYSVSCRITGAHEDVLIGKDGRTLDSLQYLLRKMVSRHLPDRMMLSLDVGNYREQRAENLKARALELASLVKDDGKTQAIPALNPSERRVVHMLLQEDKDIRSRSVGEGLFKKVLIYKPGKKKKSGSRKGKGHQGGRSSGSD
jgi:spoIIIJ-associated protein